jgi:hypothetical protein
MKLLISNCTTNHIYIRRNCRTRNELSTRQEKREEVIRRRKKDANRKGKKGMNHDVDEVWFDCSLSKK